MDDDEAFLYGDDDAPEQSVDLGKPAGAQSIMPAPQPALIPDPARRALSPGTPTLPPPSDHVQRTLELASNALIPSEPSPIPARSHSPEPAAVQLAQATAHYQSQNHDVDMDAVGVADDESEEDEEEGGDEQGLLEDSDEDLDIILEGDTSIAPTAPSSRPSTQPMRFETPRDSAPLGRPIEQPNVTTEYKPLERADVKLPDPISVLPPKPSPNPATQPYPSPRHAPQNTSHNRLPTPEHFPVSGTPPPQPPVESKPPDLQAENPVVPSSYDDKDGSALMNFDFDALPESEKGWKRPGAHVADWFNYGFDETTWRTYVMKQKRMRKEEGWASNPFAAFALGHVEQAWEGLPPELKDVMMGVIMGNPSGSRNNNHAPQMPPSIPPMMVMNPMMQGMEMGAFGMQGMSNMMAGGNPQMNGGHNPGINNQHNEGASRAIKQDPGGASEQTEDSPARYGDEMDPREQHHHEQQRIQDQMRHMQHMHHMGMGGGFLPGMDLAAMFGNQEHPMFMNGPSYNGMMEMPQMPHLQHIPSQMQQQQQQQQQQQPLPQQPQPQQQPIPGPPISMSVPGNNSTPTSTPVNPALAVQAGARPDSPSIATPITSSAPGPANHTATPGDSPGVAAISSPASARGRAARPGGRGRGNAQASAFLAAAAARGRGRVISASNSVMPLAAVLSTPAPSPKIDPPVQVAPVTLPPATTTPASPAPPTAESSAERPSVRPVSPLPSNVPTGPRRALPVSGPPPRGPRAGTGGYFDKDAAGGRGDEGLDYGGGGGESPRDDRKSMSRRHSHKSEREKSEKEFRGFEKQEDPLERARSKSRDKELFDDKESLHKSSKPRHRHRARSRSRDPDHRSSRERGEKDKEDAAHKAIRAPNGGRRNRRNRRATEGDEREDEREPHEAGDERDKEREREREREKDKDKDGNEYVEGDYSAPLK